MHARESHPFIRESLISVNAGECELYKYCSESLTGCFTCFGHTVDCRESESRKVN
jgi:hypothetical protein